MNAREMIEALEGRWHGTYGTARCPAHNDRNPSLKVSDDPNKRDGIDLHCFSGCDWRDVKRVLQRQGLLSGRDRDTPSTPSTPRQPPPKPRANDEDRACFARDIWAGSKPAPGTIVETYLKARGITAPIPPTIRHHPGLKHGPTGLLLPAMVSAIAMVPNHRVVAIHRTFLKADGSGKAPVSNARMMLGSCGGGAVRLAAAGPMLGVCEGIETGFSVMQELPDFPVWAALSVSGLTALVLPSEVREVVILADGDNAGEAAAQVAARRFLMEGRRVRIARPPRGLDFNDMLIGQSSVDEAAA